MEERTDPRITRRAQHHVPVGESFEDVVQVIDLRALEEHAASYRGDDVETDRSKTAIYVRPSAHAATVAAVPAVMRGRDASTKTDRPRRVHPSRRPEVPGPTIRSTRATQRLVLPAVGARAYADLEPTQLISRARPLAWPSPGMWALFGMAVVTLLSVGACAALVLMRI